MADKKVKNKRIDKSTASRQNIFQKSAAFVMRTARKMKQFFSSLKAELKRVVWPDRKKLVQSTATVLAICLMVGLLLFVIDSVLSGSLNALGFYSPNPTTVATTTAETTAETTTGTSGTVPGETAETTAGD
jgi:preprotein translocase subunit SecE